MRYSAILFDLDGTVLDTLQNITDAVNHTTRQFGLPEVSAETMKRHLGWGVDYLLRRLFPELPEERVLELLAVYRPWYAAHTTDKVCPYPGILPMLERLHGAGQPMAIISNKPDAAVQPLHEQYFRGLIRHSVGELPGVARKPASEMLQRTAEILQVELSRCLYVGDTEVDIRTADNAGIDCVCVSWGFRTRGELELAGAKRIVETAEELASFILGAE